MDETLTWSNLYGVCIKCTDFPVEDYYDYIVVGDAQLAAHWRPLCRKSHKYMGLKLALALTLSMVCLLVDFLFLAYGSRRKTRNWAVKHNSYKEEQTISRPFSFHIDSTTWVADIKQATSVPVLIFEKQLLNFTFADLLSATCHFDRGSLLVEGKFGPVYGGLLLGGVHVAVKVLVHGSIMTDHEVARELEYLGRIKHHNLVSMTGYCLAGDFLLLLKKRQDFATIRQLFPNSQGIVSSMEVFANQMNTDPSSQ